MFFSRLTSSGFVLKSGRKLSPAGLHVSSIKPRPTRHKLNQISPYADVRVFNFGDFAAESQSKPTSVRVFNGSEGFCAGRHALEAAVGCAAEPVLAGHSKFLLVEVNVSFDEINHKHSQYLPFGFIHCFFLVKLAKGVSFLPLKEGCFQASVM